MEETNLKQPKLIVYTLVDKVNKIFTGHIVQSMHTNELAWSSKSPVINDFFEAMATLIATVALFTEQPNSENYSIQLHIAPNCFTLKEKDDEKSTN